MIKKYIGLVGLLLLVGCGVNGAVEETAVLPTTANILKTVAAPTAGADIIDGAIPANATAVVATNDGENDMDSDEDVVQETAVGSTGVGPTIVDLSKLTPSAPTEPSEPRVMPAPGVPNPLLKLQNEAAQDLGQRLGVDISKIEMVQSVSAEWRDGSLGCPQPGTMYTQALTSGYQIMLRVAGKDYFYHTNGTNSFVFCENAKPLTATNK